MMPADRNVEFNGSVSRTWGASSAATRAVTRLVAICMMMSLVVSGCQGGSPLKSLGIGSGTGKTDTSAEAQMREDANRFNATLLGGTVAGCAIGAVVAALGCKLSGSDASKVRTCALAGCVVLGAVGAADGYSIAKKQQASRDKVRESSAIAADMRQDNQKIQAFLDSSGKVLNESRARLKEINAQTAARAISADQATAERKKVEQNRDLMQKTLDDVKKTRDVYRDAAQKADTSTGSCSRSA